jgi:pentatricopeptide repeat protein
MLTMALLGRTSMRGKPRRSEAAFQSRCSTREVFGFLRAVENRFGVAPNEYVLASALTTVLDATDLSTAIPFIHDAFDRGVRLDVACQTSLMRAMARAGQLRLARQVFNSMESPDARSFSMMMTLLMQAGQGDRVAELWDR